MTFTFDPAARLVVVVGYVTGPRRTARVRLAVDTGAVGTLVSSTFLGTLGITPAPSAPRRRMRSATGGATAPVVRVRQLLALGQVRPDFAVAAHDLPLGVTYDGLLGLDFFRGRVLTLDFARGRVSLGPPRPWWRFWR